jgi:hypothetical protein
MKENAMKKEKCLIEIIKPSDPVYDHHLDSLGIGHHEKAGQLRYRHIETKEEFVHLDGAVAWPGKDHLPGFILVVGVQMEGKAPRFKCMEEAEDAEVVGILSKCLTLREKYGFHLSDRFLFQLWWGLQSFPSLVNRFNEDVRKGKDEPEGVYFADPSDFKKGGKYFEAYSQGLKESLRSKMITLGDCNRLRNAINSFPDDAPQKFSEDDCPPVFALGSLVHSLLATKPWLNRGPLTQEPDDYESYALKDREKDPFYPFYGGGRRSNQVE